MTALEEFQKLRKTWVHYNLKDSENATTPRELHFARLADAAIESLKCCGNCRHLVCRLYCRLTEDEAGNIDGVSGARKQCVFPDSMWQECTP
jgi:hypothetical protein